MHVKLVEDQIPKTGRQTIFTMYLQHVQVLRYTCDFKAEYAIQTQLQECRCLYDNVLCKGFSIYICIKSQPDVNRNTVFKSQLMLRLREDKRQESKHNEVLHYDTLVTNIAYSLQLMLFG